jgi:hypothetical protein
MTGYADAQALPPGLTLDSITVIRKPFTADALCAAVDAVVAKGPAATTHTR